MSAECSKEPPASQQVLKPTRILHAPPRIPSDLRWLLITRQSIWRIYDALIACASAVLAFHLSPHFQQGISTTQHAAPTIVIVVFPIAFLVAAVCMGMYERGTFGSVKRSILIPLATSAAAWIVVLFGHYAVSFQILGRWIILVGAILASLGTLLPRFCLSIVSHFYPPRVLVLGDAAERSLVQKLSQTPHALGFCILPASWDSGRFTYLGDNSGADNLAQFVGMLKAEFIAVGSKLPPEVLRQAAECIAMGISVTSLMEFVEEAFEKVAIEVIDLNWLLSANIRLTRPIGKRTKRAFDLMLSLLGLAITLPAWPIIALAIKLTSKGPIFYTQTRAGQGGRPFRIIKFRSMHLDAESDGKPVWAGKNDPRSWWFGRLLRLTRLDEIPQFINVLKGDMSVIGPRPERPELVEGLVEKIPTFSLRTLVKPGITGMAQVRFRYGATTEDAMEKLRHDLYYVKHWSILLDVVIMLRTLGALMKGSR